MTVTDYEMIDNSAPKTIVTQTERPTESITELIQTDTMVSSANIVTSLTTRTTSVTELTHTEVVSDIITSTSAQILSTIPTETITKNFLQSSDIPEEESETVIQTEMPSSENEQIPKETSTIQQTTTEISEELPDEPQNHILIAYFTRAENVYLENPDEIDIDATSSASLLLPENVAVMANHIQSIVGGDLFSIVAEDAYPADYESCLKRVTDEQEENAHLSLKNHLDNIDDYDIIFLGYPNWGYICPMAVFSFLEEYDFSGKTIIPFCTHGTGGLAGTVPDITEILPKDCTILQPIGVSRSDISNCEDTIAKWISELELY